MYEPPHTYVDVSEMNGRKDKNSGLEKRIQNLAIFRILVILLVILLCLTFVSITMAGYSLGQYSGLDKRLNELSENPDKDVTEPQQQNPVYYSSYKGIKEKQPGATSGVYKMIVSGTVVPLDLYCDMTTAGGGWTLVYSYGYTDYENFRSSPNAVTPIPNWTKGKDGNFLHNNVEVSTTPPLNENERGALEFHLWNNIGSEFMVKSTINNWIKCKPGSGSLVAMTTGTITCQTVHEVLDCFEQAKIPNKLQVGTIAPHLVSDSTIYYYWDGSTTKDWPVADPCGKTQENQKKGVPNPGGAIFIK